MRYTVFLNTIHIEEREKKDNKNRSTYIKENKSKFFEDKILLKNIFGLMVFEQCEKVCQKRENREK